MEADSLMHSVPLLRRDITGVDSLLISILLIFSFLDKI